MSPSFCPNEGSFGPGADCRYPDFTLAFEASILFLLTDALFLVGALLRIASLRSKTHLLARRIDPLLLAKACVSLLCIASGAAYLGLITSKLHDSVPGVFIGGLALSFVATLLLAVLIYLEHGHSPSPSSLALCYSFLKSVFVAASLRSFNRIPDTPSNIIAIASLTVASYVACFFTELSEKNWLLKPEWKDRYVGEATFSMVSRSLFFWLLPLMWKGRNTHLTLDTLGNVSYENRASGAVPPLATEWNRLKGSGSKHRLLRATFAAFKWQILAPVAARLVLLGATLSQPFLTNRMLKYFSSDNRDETVGWLLVAGYVCVYGMIALSTSIYWQNSYAITVRYRAAVVGMVYRKSLRLSSHSGREVGTGGASTYMSVDVERISEGLEMIHEFWAGVLCIPAAIAILYSQVHYAAFAPLGVIILIFSATSQIGKAIGSVQGAWLRATDARIKLFSSILGNIVPIRMSGFQHVLGKKVLELRKTEMVQCMGFYKAALAAAAISNSASAFVGLSVLGTAAAISKYSSGGYDLTSTKIFTVLTTVNLLDGPLNMVGQGLPSVLAAYASLKHVQKFLELDEKHSSLPEIGTEEVGIDTEKAVAEEEKLPEPKFFSMQKASFSWSPDSAIVLKDFTLELTPGKMHMCIGPVAAGKTTLLESILGETCLREGIMSPSDHRIAYASQDAFIVVGKCRDNITFGRPFDQAWYDKVVYACALVDDFARMPLGDRTVLGEKGITLSGGQRQRLALARAIYADAPLLLLDDVLSALDAETERHVFNALFAQGGLARDKTVLLSTHNVHHLPSADRIIALENGSIAQDGTYPELIASKYDLAGSLAHASSAKADEGDDAKKAEAGSEKKSTSDEKAKEEDEELDDEALISYHKGGAQAYKFYGREMGYFRLLVFLGMVAMYIALRMGIQGYVQDWSVTDGHNLAAWMGGYTAFALASLTVTWITYYSYAVMCTETGLNAHRSELDAVLSAPISLFLSIPPGRLVNRFSSDIFQLDFTWPISALNVVATTGIITAILVLVYIATPWLAISAPIFAFIYWLLMKFYLGTSKQFQQLESASKSPLYTIFSNTLGGLDTVRAFQAEAFFRDQADRALDRSQSPFYYRFGGLRFLRTTLATLTMVIAVGLAALAIGLRNSTAVSFLGLALSNVVSLTSFLSNLMMSYSMMENGVVSIRRIHEMVLLEPERDPGADSALIPKEAATWPQHGSLVFQDLELKYREDLDPALKGISFTVKGGQKIGICGRTGSGKSSTVMALFRGIDQSLIKGRILLDGVDTATIPLELLRNSLSLVSQEPFLWHAPLRELLDIEGTQSEDRIWKALERVGLKQAVSDMPNKLDTIIEDGGSLSRGQKQLLCLARILLRGSRVVVLDEATSSMDVITDAKIKEVVDSDLSDRTIVAVAHRISTIINFDLILVLEQGSVAEFGSPKDLLLDPASRFSRLAAAQGLGPQSHGEENRPSSAQDEIEVI